MASRRLPKQTPAEARTQRDMLELMALPSFRRLLLRIWRESGMSQSAYGSEDRRLQSLEGRRSLGFEIFRWCDEATLQPEFSALRAALAEDDQPPGDPEDEDQDQPIELD